ncbi:MAG: DUF378 domain-containing protein [Candidatus Borkfalkiaceae bacterium]|nr:DUF378 domain-containing protein [Christensenellaceae bacterium]
MKITSIIAFILVIVGALVWLGVGIFAVDVVALIFGSLSVVSRIIYCAVGLAGLFMIYFIFAYRPFKELN